MVARGWGGVGSDGRKQLRLLKGSTKDPCDGTVLDLDCGCDHTNLHV